MELGLYLTYDESGVLLELLNDKIYTRVRDEEAEAICPALLKYEDALHSLRERIERIHLELEDKVQYEAEEKKTSS